MSLSIRGRVATLAAIGALVSTPALAQKTPAQRADELNDEGKQLYKAGKAEAAVGKFRQAVVLSPEGRFYFNVCFVLDKLGRHRDAITACEAITADNASQELVAKAGQFIEQLRGKLGSSAPPPDQGGGHGGHGDHGGQGDIGQGDGPTGSGGEGGDDSFSGAGTPVTPVSTAGPQLGASGITDSAPPPTVSGKAHPDTYKWSLGAELGPVRNISLGRGQNADDMAFVATGVTVKGHASFLLHEHSRFGVQPYAHFTNLGGDRDAVIANAEPLSILDLGGAFFQDRRLLSDRLFWSWLGGGHISFLTIGTVSEEALVTLGLRAELSVSYLHGEQYQHEFRVTPVALNVYMPVAAQSGGLDASAFNLDRSGSTWAFTVGYVLRFHEPFGSTPLFELE
jgi:hypothetical protein